MQEVQLILGLLLVVAVLVLVADKFDIPYPILLVVGGLAIGFIPGLPQIEIEPELIFLLFLPPILQMAAYSTSGRDFRANLRSILMLAVGLPIFTMVLVAVVAHALIPELNWAAAFVLGAIVSPPDAVATTAIARKVGLPRRIVTILEGESLLNDATALVALRLAIAAVATGAFSPGEAAFSFVLTALGGIVVGFVIAQAATWLFHRMDNAPIEITIQLLSGYGSYVLAETFHVSGVIAVVTTGLIFGRNGSRLMSAETRIRATSVWAVVDFLLNGLIFILIGLQLPGIVSELSEYEFVTLLTYSAAVTLTVILARLVWMPFGAWIPRLVINGIKGRTHEPLPSPKYVFITGWAGMRGIVSLAAALSLPIITNNDAFPGRELIIFITFVVILATLLAQGLTLPLLVRVLKIRDDGTSEREERKARLEAASAATIRLEELSKEDWVTSDAIHDLRTHYKERQRIYSDELDKKTRKEVEEEAHAHKRIRHELLQAEREALIRLRDEGTIADEVLRHVERDLDLEQEGLRL